MLVVRIHPGPCGPIAQMAEARGLNPRSLGSNPSGAIATLAQLAEAAVSKAARSGFESQGWHFGGPGSLQSS